MSSPSPAAMSPELQAQLARIEEDTWTSRAAIAALGAFLVAWFWSASAATVVAHVNGTRDLRDSPAHGFAVLYEYAAYGLYTLVGLRGLHASFAVTLVALLAAVAWSARRARAAHRGWLAVVRPGPSPSPIRRGVLPFRARFVSILWAAAIAAFVWSALHR